MSERALAARIDAGFEEPAGMSIASVEREEVSRLAKDAQMALAASEIPRRLANASRGELATDRRRSRRVGYVFLTVLRFYGAKQGDWNKLVAKAVADPDARKAGATVDWEAFVEERSAWLEQRAGHIAKFAFDNDVIPWGNRMLFRLDRERELLAQAMEDSP